MKQPGGQVVRVTEPIEVITESGQYMRSQSLPLAQLQSQQIGKGWKSVHQYGVDRGLPANGREPYGYLAHRVTHTRNDGALRLCPQGCAAGECHTSFAPDPQTAPVEQLRCRSHHDNGRWYPGAHQPLIGQERWDAYQRRREAQRIVPTKGRSPKVVPGRDRRVQSAGPMYCTSSQRGEQYALYCGTQRTSGTYRTRQPVEAAAALWLGQFARAAGAGHP